MRQLINRSQAQPSPIVFVTPPATPDDDVIRIVTQAIRGGVTHVVIRRPASTARDIHALATSVNAVVRGAGATMLIADRLDVALAIDGAGVQLGAGSLPPEVARPLLPGRIMGVSVHSRDEALAASAAGADWVIAGNIYETATHPGRPGRGPEAIRDMTRAMDTPLIAIGGITARRIPDVIAAGAAGIAVIRAISDAPDPERATRALRDALDNATGGCST